MRPNAQLIARRQELRLTQKDVAQKAGISRAYYTIIEVGRKTPSMSVAKRIADALSTTVDRLFFEQNVPIRNENRSA